MHLIREQWVVTLALTPLTLLLFGQVSVVGFARQPGGDPLGDAGGHAAGAGRRAVGAACGAWRPSACSRWQRCCNGWRSGPGPLWSSCLPRRCGRAWRRWQRGALLAMRLPWRLRLLALPLLLPVLWWQPAAPGGGQFELLAADIGQGNAVLVRTATHTLLYDAGPRFSRESDAGHRVLVPLLRALGEQVDVLMLSHRDADHTGGAAAVLAQQPHGAELTGSHRGRATPCSRLRPSQQPCLAGQRWEWDGVAFRGAASAAR